MIIKHVDETSINTDELGDVDSLLLEKTSELQKLYAQYSRQVFISAEVKGHKEAPVENGVAFFHVSNKDDSPEILKGNIERFWTRVNKCILGMSGGRFFVGVNNQ